MNLLLIAPAEIDPSNTVTLTGARASHLKTVLRVVPEQRVRIGVEDGPCGTGIVQRIDGASVVLRCELDAETPPRPAVDLLLALPRPKVLKRLWPQLAALGVGRILLTNAGRVERHYFDTHLLTPAGWRPLLLEGLQQARDTRVPIVSVHRQLKVLVEDQLDTLAGGALRIVAEPAADAPLWPVVCDRAPSRVMLAVGPEGGWNPFELALLQAHRFIPATIGRRTLRSDTACIALLTTVHAVMSHAALRISHASTADFSARASDLV